MHKHSPTDHDAADFPPIPEGRVIRLKKDWPALLDLMPKLHTAATIYRSPEVLLCRMGRFAVTRRSGTCAYRLDGPQGDALRTDLWSEAWWYEERRDGILRPCLEIADEKGRGFLKLCYRSTSDAAPDLTAVADLAESEGDGWDMLHVRQSNVLDCGCMRGRRKLPAAGPVIREGLTRLFHEFCMQGRPLGVVLPHNPATTWDEVPTERVTQAGCWTMLAGGGCNLHLRATHFHHAEVLSRSARPVMIFKDETGDPLLTLVAPEGPEPASIAAFQRALSKHSSDFQR